MSNTIDKIRNNLNDVKTNPDIAKGSIRVTPSRSDSILVEWEPGDATRYPFVISDLSGLALGWGSGEVVQITLVWDYNNNINTFIVRYDQALGLYDVNNLALSRYNKYMICAFTELMFGHPDRTVELMRLARQPVE